MSFLKRTEEFINLLVFGVRQEPASYIIKVVYTFIFIIFFIFFYSHRDYFEPYYDSFIESITSLFDTKPPVEEIPIVKEEIKPVEEAKVKAWYENKTVIVVGVGVVAVTGTIFIVGGTGAVVSFAIFCFDATSYFGGV